jgi:hypothetical protein
LAIELWVVEKARSQPSALNSQLIYITTEDTESTEIRKNSPSSG